MFLPPPPESYSRDWATRMTEFVKRALNKTLSTETANDSVLIKSPGGKVYLKTIDENGNWVTTYIKG